MLVRVLANLPSGPSRADPVVKQDALAQIAKVVGSCAIVMQTCGQERLFKD